VAAVKKSAGSDGRKMRAAMKKLVWVMVAGVRGLRNAKRRFNWSEGRIQKCEAMRGGFDG
jgi:hypothetical protein